MSHHDTHTPDELEDHDLGLSHDLPILVERQRLGRRRLRDLTRGFGDASGVAEGVPTTLRMTVYDLSGSEVTPLEGAAVYVWHCDREGNYALYSEAAKDENYLRGVQAADADGVVELLPQDVCEDVYATEGYEASVDNLAQLSLDSDMVFADGWSLQMAEVTGSVEAGYTVSLNVPV